MIYPEHSGLSRRDVLKTAGSVAAASTLAGVAMPAVHQGSANVIQLALVGCGGRGTGAAGEAMTSPGGNTRLVAMADVFQTQLNNSHRSLSQRHGQQVAVPADNRFVGFDGYRQAMDALRPGDIVILATPPAFRWVHFTYAIEKRLNVFMEKPVAVDGPSVRRMMALANLSEQRGLKVGVGLMCRHCTARRELFSRIKEGQIGDLTLLRAYRMAGPTATAFAGPKPNNMTELMYQIRNFHAFLWLSGGASDFLIHNIDECCWMKDAWPISARGAGGRHYRGTNIDQNFDTYSCEYTFSDGAKLFLEGRTMSGCANEFASFAHGTRAAATISYSGHTPCRAKIFGSQNINNNANNIVWRCMQNEPNPYQLEWDHLLDAIRRDQPYNEVRRGAEASLITAMGRLACHTGQVITRDQMYNHDHEFAPNVDQLTLDGPSPLLLQADGKYPVPRPGVIRREY